MNQSKQKKEKAAKQLVEWILDKRKNMMEKAIILKQLVLNTEQLEACNIYDHNSPEAIILMSSDIQYFIDSEKQVYNNHDIDSMLLMYISESDYSAGIPTISGGKFDMSHVHGTFTMSKHTIELENLFTTDQAALYDYTLSHISQYTNSNTNIEEIVNE